MDEVRKWSPQTFSRCRASFHHGKIKDMKTEAITIQVDPDAATAYRAASEDERRKLDLLLSLRLNEVTRPGASLRDVMRDISRKAQSRGLTPEILQSILDER